MPRPWIAGSRLDEAAERYGVSAASVARLALAAGLPATVRKLEREAEANE